VRTFNIAGEGAKGLVSSPQIPSESASVEFTSKEKGYQREIMNLLRKFEERGWRIPKAEIPELNKQVFVNVRKAAAVYRSGYFTFDRKSQTYIATEEAKKALRDWRKEKKVILVNFAPTNDKDTPGDPHLLKNRMMQSAMANESFFSELTAEGLTKLEASMPAEEKEEAMKWLETTMAYHLDNFTTLDEFFDFFDNVRAYLDTFALVAKNSQKLVRDARVQD
jgi:hypothetical protein